MSDNHTPAQTTNHAPADHALAKRDVVLSVRDLEVEFRSLTDTTRAVKRVSLDLERGQTLALVGESGSGKSVTSYSILRLIKTPGRITGGSIVLSPRRGPSIDVLSLPPKSPELLGLRGGKISMIFQEPMTALSPVYTVGNQLREALRLHRPMPRREADRECVKMLGKVGLHDPEERFKQYPFEMSGGMRQRVVIAMALITRPEIVIADEPTTALDVTVQAQVLALLDQLKREFGASVLFITHDLGVVAQVADEVAVMKRGRVVETGAVRQVIKTPRHPYTQMLMDSMPRLDADDTQLAAQRRARAEFVLPERWSFDPPIGDPQAEPEYLTLEPGRRLMVWPRTAGNGLSRAEPAG